MYVGLWFCKKEAAFLTTCTVPQYFFQIDDSLAWSQNTNGPEPIFDQTHKGPKKDLLAASDDPSWRAPEPTTE